ncbi:MAG: hypothetical protein HDS66_00460 [Bacteroidales bacterium]|nr:hypothetical protein [Bacteroidales bacterium]
MTKLARLVGFKEFLIGLLPFWAMFVACDSERNDEPVMDNQEDNTEQVTDDAEMPDDGMRWIENAPSKSEFDRLVLGKTWEKQALTYLDSRGNELPFHLWIGGGLFEPWGFKLETDSSLIADAGTPFLYPQMCYKRTWVYDEKTGRVSLFSNEIVKPASWNSSAYYLVESLTEDEIVLRGQFGCLRKYDYEYINELPIPEGAEREVDADSYGRAVYKTVPADEVTAFWDRYPEMENIYH